MCKSFHYPIFNFGSFLPKDAYVNLVDLVKSFPTSKKEAKGAAPGRRQKATSGDKGTQKATKARVAPKRK